MSPDDTLLWAIQDGAYDLYGPAGGTRKPEATIFLPNENEWYKAAYYDPQSAGYFTFPANSNFGTSCGLPTAAPNTANCGGDADGDTGPLSPTAVGSYPGSPSPYGTFDQSGNVHEWNETMIGSSSRGLRGGYFSGGYGWLAASTRDWGDPSTELDAIGFRVAAVVPEPGTALLFATGLAALAGRRRILGRDSKR